MLSIAPTDRGILPGGLRWAKPVGRASRKRSAAARSASSGSTPRRRERPTSESSRSPSQRSAPSRASGSAGGGEPASGSARRSIFRAYSRPGKVLGDVGERLLASALDLALDPIPVAQDPAGGRGVGLHRRDGLGARLVAEHVRVAADQLRGHLLGDLAEVAGAALLEQQRQEEHLEQDVAELVAKLGVVAAARGVGQLVGLLDRVGDDRALVLLAVPRALAPQTPGDLVETLQGGRRLLRRPAALRHRRPAASRPAGRPAARRPERLPAPPPGSRPAAPRHRAAAAGRAARPRASRRWA